MATDIIEQLGGVAEVAKATNVKPNRVHNWQSRGIPWPWRPRIAEMLKKAGHEMPAGFLDPPADAA